MAKQRQPETPAMGFPPLAAEAPAEAPERPAPTLPAEELPAEERPQACTCKAGRYSVSQAGCRPGTIDRTTSCLECGATRTDVVVTDALLAKGETPPTPSSSGTPTP